MPEDRSSDRELRDELVRVRSRAGISSRGIASRINLNRGVVWRFDNGKGPIPRDRISVWLDVCGVTGEERDRILALAASGPSDTRPWRDLLAERGHLQDSAAAREKDAVLVRGFQNKVWPGLLQTPEYSTLIFTMGRTRDVDGAVARRLARQAVLFEGARFEFLVTEGVVHRDFGRPDILAAQLDRVRSVVATSEAVSVGVVPDSTPVLDWNNFIVWATADDARFVTTELIHGEQELVSEEDVAVYDGLWTKLAESAREWR